MTRISFFSRSLIIGLTTFFLVSSVHAQVSPAVREYRLHLFDPEISILANRTFDLMFDIARVEPGTKVWHLPVQSHPLD